MWVETTAYSQTLGNERRLWCDIADDPKSPVVVLLDGEYYVEKMDAPSLIAGVVSSGGLRSASYVYVSHINGRTRWDECFCNSGFSRFVNVELPEFMESQYGFRPSQWVLGGLSLTGLAAVHAALARFSPYKAVIAQSGSFWWNDCWLPRQTPETVARKIRFRMCCGIREVDAPVDHGDGLLQSTDQLTSNNLMVNTLRLAGHTVCFLTYDGGHDLKCWADDLPKALADVIDREGDTAPAERTR